MYKQESHLHKIIRFLSQLKTEVELRNSINLYDINIHAEYFYRDLFNLVFDWELDNLNIQTKNAAYIDLIDEKNKKAIQVTSQNDNGKISDTIKGFFANPENKDFELKVLLISKSAKDYRTDFTFDGKYKFNHEEDVIDVERLLAEIRNKSIEDIEKIADFLSKQEPNFSSSVPKMISPTFLKVPSYFTGRSEVLKDIFNTVQTHRIASLCGIKGIGKTSVIYKFVEEHLSIYQHIIFVPADRDSFLVNFNNACSAMSLVFANDETEQAKIEKFAKKLEEICSNLEEDKFVLLIFDNSDDIGQIAKFVPTIEKLQVLLTSNFQEIHDIGHGVEINKFSDEEAKLFLYRKSKNNFVENLDNVSIEEQTALLQIAELLGHHPFALSVSGLYIRKKQKTFDEYLNRLQNTQGKILKDEAGVDQYQHPTIYSAFLIPFNDILEVNGDSEEEKIISQISLECLKITALLSADNIPEEILKNTLILIFTDYFDFIDNEDSWDSIYQNLSSYGFIERNPYRKTFSIHRLFQLFLKTELNEETETVERPLLKILDNNFEHFDFNNKTKTDRYLIHIKAFLKYVEDNNLEKQINYPLENETTFLLRRKLAKYYEDIGLWNICTGLYRANNANYKEAIGNLDMLYAIMLNDEAKILILNRHNSNEKEDSLPQAKSLIKEAIKIGNNEIKRLRNPSEIEVYKNHLNTFYGNLVNFYAVSDDIEKSIQLCKKLINDLELKGEENTSLYSTRLNNLANALKGNSKFNDARLIQRKCLKIDKRTLPKIHVDYLKHILNYAIILTELEKYRFAEKVFEIAKFYFDDDIYVNHPDKANFYFWFGVFCGKINELLKAKDLLEMSLAIYTQNYGYENPNALKTVEELEIIKQLQKQVES